MQVRANASRYRYLKPSSDSGTLKPCLTKQKRILPTIDEGPTMISFLRQCALTVAVSSLALFALVTSTAADAAEPTSTEKVSAAGFHDDSGRQRGQGNVSGSMTQFNAGEYVFRWAGLTVLAAGSVAIYTVRRRNPNNS